MSLAGHVTHQFSSHACFFWAVWMVPALVSAFHEECAERILRPFQAGMSCDPGHGQEKLIRIDLHRIFSGPVCCWWAQGCCDPSCFSRKAGHADGAAGPLRLRRSIGFEAPKTRGVCVFSMDPPKLVVVLFPDCFPSTRHANNVCTNSQKRQTHFTKSQHTPSQT